MRLLLPCALALLCGCMSAEAEAPADAGVAGEPGLPAARASGCGGPQATTYQQGDSTCVTHTGCAAPATLCTVEGGGHTWPGGLVPQDPFGKTTQELDASREMWRFFAGHALPLP